MLIVNWRYYNYTNCITTICRKYSCFIKFMTAYRLSRRSCKGAALMRNVKLYVAAILAVATSLAVFSCGNKNKQSDGKYNKDLDSSTREELNSIASGDDMLKGDLKNKTIK